MLQKNKNITIIGAGLAGCFLAILLAKRGYTVDIYERFSQKELTETASNRSFNLTFYYRGTQILKRVGLWNKVKPLFRILEGSNVHTNYHNGIFMPFDTVRKPQYTLERTALIRTILHEAMQYKDIHFHFDTNIISIDRRNKTITIQTKRMKTPRVISCSIVIGADGVHSTVRPALQQGQEASHTQEYLPWTYKQVAITKAIADELQWRESSQHFVHGKQTFLVAFPNANSSFTAMVLLPKTGTYTFAKLKTRASIEQFLTDRFPKLKAAHQLFIKALLTNPEGHLVTIKTSPWYYKDFLVLIGDAAHGVLPFYGQGVTAAFEDCVELDKLIARYGNNWQKVFSLYQEKRKKNTDALAYFSKESFQRLNRYKQADYAAVENRLDHIMHTLMPKFWLPPISRLIAHDPSQYADILTKHQHRQKVAKVLGISAAATTIYGALLVKEKLLHRYQN